MKLGRSCESSYDRCSTTHGRRMLAASPEMYWLSIDELLFGRRRAMRRFAPAVDRGCSRVKTTSSWVTSTGAPGTCCWTSDRSSRGGKQVGPHTYRLVGHKVTMFSSGANDNGHVNETNNDISIFPIKLQHNSNNCSFPESTKYIDLH